MTAAIKRFERITSVDDVVESATRPSVEGASGWDLYSGKSLLGSVIAENLPETERTWLLGGSTVLESAIFAQVPVQSDVRPFSNRMGRLLGRLRALRNLSSGRGGRAAPAVRASVDSAIQFVARAEMPLSPIATLDDDGIAVIEMEDDEANFFADISFLEDGAIEIYRREDGKPSEIVAGSLEDEQIEGFLRDQVGVLI